MSQRGDIPSLGGARVPVDVMLAPIYRFLRREASGGIVMLVCAVGAMIWANSGGAAFYRRLFHDSELVLGIDSWRLMGEHPQLVTWINDALMAAFFFVVGLEIKREVLVGELASVKKAAVPIVAAIGGMVVPALIYTAFNHGEASERGWGIPMATDIAFALGAIALLGKRVPPALRVFLAALAITDDIGALLVIAVFYTSHLEWWYIWGALACLGVMGLLNLAGVKRVLPFALVGLVLWYMVLESGIHATIAGVAGAMMIPVRARVDTERFSEYARDRLLEFNAAGEPGRSILTNPRQQGLAQAIDDACDKVQTPLHRLENIMSPWVAYLIIPIFALANAGVPIEGSFREVATNHVTLGVVLGLAIGKPLGITLASWIAVKSGIAALPRDVTWPRLHGAAWLGGIGFTMSLFIATLAFESGEILDWAKLAILSGSVISACVGIVVLTVACRGRANPQAGGTTG